MVISWKFFRISISEDMILLGNRLDYKDEYPTKLSFRKGALEEYPLKNEDGDFLPKIYHFAAF